MPLYDFDFVNLNPQKLVDARLDPKARSGTLERRPIIETLPPKSGESKNDIWFEKKNVATNLEIKDLLPQGLRTMDRGIKNYFSGIRVPTRDGYRIMQVRISGGDKPYLIWAQDLKRGRVSLPVMAIKREREENYAPKFSSPHVHTMNKRFVDNEGTKIALAPRPVPLLISYTLSVWAEHKRDLEYIQYQIRTRFNPVAEFMTEDKYLRGSVLLKYGGMSSAVDDEMPADQRANKRYDFSIEMEGWSPLPEKHVPSILGRVTNFREYTVKGDILETIIGKDILNSAQIRR